MIKNLQSLRGLAAILIFYHHYGFGGDVVMSFGDFGVVFFMMLSGFVLYLSTDARRLKTSQEPRFSTFMLARLRKIYPMYLICWIAAILVLGYSGSFLGKVLGLFALQSWVPLQQVYFAGNSVSWFISDLLFCYLLFVPLYKLILHKTRTACVLIAAYFVAYFAVVAALPGSLVHAVVYVNPLMQFANFLLGLLLCVYFLRHDSPFKASWTNIVQLLSVAAIIIAMLLYGYIPMRFSYGSYWWLVTVPCIYVFAKTDTSTGIMNKLLHSKPLLECGKLSFVFYLIHYIGITLWDRLLALTGCQVEDNLIKFLQSLILLALLFGASMLIQKLIESFQKHGNFRFFIKKS